VLPQKLRHVPRMATVLERAVSVPLCTQIPRQLAKLTCHFSVISDVRMVWSFLSSIFAASFPSPTRCFDPRPSHPSCSLAASPLQPSLETFGPHRGAVTAIAVTPDASRLVTGGVDCTLVVWNIHTRTSLHIVAVREPVVALLSLLHSPVFSSTTQLPQPQAFKKSVTPVSQLVVQLPALCGMDSRSP
jgi:WD40 repeat protein